MSINFYPKKVLEKEKVKQNPNLKNDYLNRPARKQVEQSLASQFAYKQGDEEYNIWYDKYLTDNKFKDKEQALTRCDPDLDSGYTKVDHHEKFSSYFCIHFAKGCCCEGANCKYYHRVPSFNECLTIDQSKDIFGRSRFANHREDMSGIGSFLKECKTLYVSEFKLITKSTDPNTELYEILWRHFSVWGEIEDINLIEGKGMAFIRYSHRCMAEFAKEAMNNQPLDFNEIITIKWANDDPDPKNSERGEIENEKNVDNSMKRKKIMEREVEHIDKYEKEKEIVEEEIEKMEMKSKQNKKIMESCYKMNEILNRIDNNGEEEVEDYRNDPYNSQPLSFNP